MFNNALKYTLLTLIIVSAFGFINAAYADQMRILELLKSGKTDELAKELQTSSGVEKQFLEAALSSNGEFAVSVYQEISDNYPSTPLGWESLQRLYEYYYTIGLYQKASAIFDRLKNRPQAALPTVPEDTSPVIWQDRVSTDAPYWIQVGAFSEKSNADRMCRELAKIGFRYKIIDKKSGGKILHIVRAGGYNDMDEAKAALEDIAEKLGITGRLVRETE